MITANHAGYVVDASVAVKWFAEEEHADAALALLDRYKAGRCRFAVPDWLFFLEIANALSRKGFEEAAVAEVLGNLWRYQLQLIGAQWNLLAKTNALSRGCRTSIYDSTYVAVAEATGFPLVTADEELLKRMKGHTLVLPVWGLEFPIVGDN